MIIEADRFRHPDAQLFPSVTATGCPITLSKTEAGEVGIGVSGVAPMQVFMALAAAKLNGPNLDCWTVSTVDRIAREGTTIPAGTPYHEQNGAN